MGLSNPLELLNRAVGDSGDEMSLIFLGTYRRLVLTQGLAFLLFRS